MPSHKSAIKRNRQTIKRTARNRMIRSEVRTSTKKINDVLAGNEDGDVTAMLKATTKVLNKAATKGVLKKKTASRRISRLAKRAHKASKTTAKA